MNIVFIKTHKTASTLIRSIIENYADSNDLKTLIPPNIEQTNFVQNMTNSYLDSLGTYNVSCRHIAYNKSFFEKHVPSAKYITIVREPLERAISHYYHLNYDNKDVIDYNEWYRNCVRINQDKYPSKDIIHSGFDNYISRWLGYDVDSQITYESLSKRYDLILHVEHMTRSIELLCKYLRVDISENIIVRKNNNERYKSFVIDDDVRESFYENNKSDVKLYALTRRIFDEYSL